MLIPNTSFELQPACFIAARETAIAYKTELSRNLYLESDCFNASILASELAFNGATNVGA